MNDVKFSNSPIVTRACLSISRKRSMDIDEAPVFSTQLSIDISVVLKDKQLEAVKCFRYFPLNNQLRLFMQICKRR